MAKRGGRVHLKRIAAPKAIPIRDKKAATWILRPSPGPHSKDRNIPLGVLLRDVLEVVGTMKEVKRILTLRLVQVDGIVRVDEKFPVGLMDVVTLIPEKKSYRLVVDWKGRLVPMEVKGDAAKEKTAKVMKKQTVKKGNINITLNDGRNILADKHINVGDSVVVKFSESAKEKAKIVEHLKLQPGARCLIREGKHAGSLVDLKQIVKRKGKKSEAIVTAGDEEFITVSNYLLVVGKDFEVKI